LQATTARVRGAGKPVDVVDLLKEEEILDKKRMEDEQRRARIRAKVSWTAKEVDPFDLLNLTPVAARGWDKGKKLSERQTAFLRKQGINPDKLEYGAAKQLIGEILGRFDTGKCTMKQAKLLKRNGYSTDMTFEQASKTIDALSKNGWHRPRIDPVPKEEIGKPIPVAAGNAVEDDNVPF
jgi:hypothetical protein